MWLVRKVRDENNTAFVLCWTSRYSGHVTKTLPSFRCGKEYKTASGLNRHVKTNHSEVDNHVIDIDRIRNVLYSTCSTIFEDQCYGERTNTAFKKYFEEESFAMENFVTMDFYSEVQLLCKNLSDKKNKELFYSRLYCNLAPEGFHLWKVKSLPCLWLFPVRNS